MDFLRFLSLNCHGVTWDTICYLKTIICTFDVILLQETWLAQFNCHLLSSISSDFVFYHSSAMEDKLHSGILGGRPFGGTAILVRNSLVDRVSVVDSHNPRITAVCLHNSNQPDLLICSVYMPYNDRSVLQLGNYELALGSLQAQIDSHHGCSFIIGGDWNVSKAGDYPAKKYVEQFCSVNNLCWLDTAHDSVDFTYHCDANSHRSLLDHFLCSSNLVADRSSSDLTNIMVDGNNTSDHYAINVSIQLQDCNPYSALKNKPFFKQRWDRADLSRYQSVCSDLLGSVHLPLDALLCTDHCCSLHHSHLENYYNSIVNCLLTAARHCVPQVKVGIEKHWWSAELEELKQRCIDITRIWRENGCPRSGSINDDRVRIKLKYKFAIKEAVNAADEEFNDELANHLCNKEINSFWKAWRKRFCSKNVKPTGRLNNKTGDKNILEEFTNYFSSVSQPNTPGADDMNRSFVTEFLDAHSNDLGSAVSFPKINIYSVQECIVALKLRKAAGHDGVTNEHIVHAGSNLSVHLTLLFNAMLLHAFVPADFRFGLICPILKDKHGDQTKLNMYRGITLAPAISKLFESVLLAKYADCLQSDNLQFGFKKNYGCGHALFSLTESVQYFNKRGSKIYCAFLDASKAFDKVLIYGLLAKLIKRNAPVHFIRILQSWYSVLRCSVIWNSLIGKPFDVICGVKQGGILSPFLFSVYVDDLLAELRKSGLGVHIGSVFAGALLYADDIALVACSCYGLQRLINICVDYSFRWDIKLNPEKSQIACFGGPAPRYSVIHISQKFVDWSESVKYLGCHFRSRTCEVNPSRFIGHFYGTFNSILNVLAKKRDDMLALHLVKTYCLPSLLYGCETSTLSNADFRSAEVAWNNAFRKLFNSFWRESVKPLQWYCHCMPLSYFASQRKILFWRKLMISDNVLLNMLAKLKMQTMIGEADRFGLKPHIVLSFGNSDDLIKKLFFDHFTKAIGQSVGF